LYALGLVYVLVALTRTKELLSRLALHAAYLGTVFHFVAIVEGVRRSGELSLASLSVGASVLAFLIMVVFLLVYMVYKTTSPGIVVFPLVFFLTFVGATRQEPFVLASATARQGWLIAHIALIFAGYAALVLSFAASLIYLLQERALKAKRLLLLTDVPGVLDKSKRLIPELSIKDARKLIADGTISGGMIPKVETCIYALEQGVQGVVIIDGKMRHAVLLELFTNQGTGTLIHK